MILVGGRGEELSVLTSHRAMAAVPFGARYRLIDFALSNCVNSGFFDITILAQYFPISLLNHIGAGKAWDLDRKHTGLKLFQPIQTDSPSNWYRGTADALARNLRQFQKHSYTLVLPGDLLYKMDFSRLLQQHKRKRSKLTIATAEVAPAQAQRYGIVEVGKDDRLSSFVEKPQQPRGNLASMAIYLFDTSFLIQRLDELPTGSHDLVDDIIIPAVSEGLVHQFRHKSYWEDVGRLGAYYRANMELLSADNMLLHRDTENPIATPTDEMPPAKFGPYAQVQQSLIANGSIINGGVVNSIVSKGVYVEEGAVVRNSLLLGHTQVRSGAVVDRAIIDKWCEVGADAMVGFGEDNITNERFPKLITDGLTLIGKANRIPKKMKIGRQVCLDTALTMSELPLNLPSGSSWGEFSI